MRDIKAYHMASGESHTIWGGDTREGYQRVILDIVDFMIQIAPDNEPIAVLSEIYLTDPDGSPLELMVMNDVLKAFASRF